MPYDANGNHSLVSGYRAVTGQTVLASQHNPPLEDISSGLSQVLLRSGVAAMTGNLRMGGRRITGMADGTADSDGATVGQAEGVMPIGAVIDYAGDAAPDKWVLCYGQAISRTTYSDLFAVIGTRFGSGNGSTTFNVPDVRGRVSAGKDDMGGSAADRLTGKSGGVDGTGLGEAGGSETHTMTEAEMARHNHGGNTGSGGSHNHDASVTRTSVTSHTHTSGGSFSAASTNSATSDTYQTESVGNHNHNISDDGDDDPHNNVQPTIIFNKIIKTGVSD